MQSFLKILFLLLFFRISLTAQGSDEPREYNFTRIDANQGLSHNQVQTIFKDSQGFMWFGTNFGLNRFDGYSFKVFRHIPSDSTSLSDNRIREIFEGPKGKLWITLVDAYIVYDPSTETFSRDDEIFHKNIEIPTNEITWIKQDNAGNIWFISDAKGLYCYQMLTDSVIHIQISQKGEYQVQNSAITSVTTDSEGSVWLVGANGILEKLELNTQRVSFRSNYLQGVYTESGTLKLYMDKEDDMWIYSSSSDEGIIHYNLKNDQYKHFHQDSPQYRLSNNIVNSVVQDDEGSVWVATDHGGINLINKKDFSVHILINNPEDSRSISQNSIQTLYKDDIGIVWLGTFKKGICYSHDNLYKFKLFQHRQNDPNSLPFNDINDFQEDENGNLWIGTNGNGLNYYDRSNNTYNQYQHNPDNQNSLSNDVIVSMLYDNDKNLWLGTYYGGLNLFDGKNFKHFRNDPANSSSLANDRVWEIYQDSKGLLWVGTLGGGLDLYQPESGTFKHYKASDENSIHSDFILHITEDNESNLWIGTDIGLEHFNRESNTFVLHTHDPDDSTSISNIVVSSVIVDSRGLVWAATQEGLNVFNKKDGIFHRYYTSDGLPDNTILSLIEDDRGDIWASTTNGISNIRVLNFEDSELQLEFVNYSEADGLQGKEFNEGVAFKTRSGELIFGGPDGFNLFDPAEITNNTLPPAVVLTDFQVYNKSILVGQQVHGRKMLKKPISQTRAITLKHFEDIISIEFSALNYIHPEKNKFEYILEGFNREWMQVSPNERKVTYTNLDAGEYTFRVRASNNDGLWNDEGVSLQILVRPPLWKTKGAIGFYILLLVAALILLRYLILQRERNKFKNKEEKLEAQRRHELDLMKIKFFTNVSHEFRTPLSLIITPLEKMLKHPEKDRELSHIKLIYRNARRLLNLVNQLLDIRRMEVQKIHLKPSYGDIVNYIKEIYKTFTDLAEKKSIHFEFKSSHEEYFTFFDHDKVEKIAFNLLSNAFKFTPEGKSILISLVMEEDDNPGNIIFKVTDTGLGIPSDSLDKVFDRFFQDDDVGGILTQGSGIGLSLTKEFVLLHNGKITVESEQGEGSCFTVSLPILKENSGEITELSKETSTQLADTISEEPTNEETLPSTQKATVLLVEDNDDFRFYLKDNLKVNYTILEAVNGKNGVDVANKHLPDLIVSDVMMPEMDGFELCKQIKTNPSTSHIPIILLTARMSEQKKLEGFEIGADDYITKPFSFELLESRMTNLIHQRERIRKTFQTKFKIEPGEIAITSLDEKLLTKALEVVEQQMGNPEFSVEKLSRELGMSRVHLYKKLTALTGKTPIEFIRIMRLKRASQLLGKSQLTVAEVAYEVGFNDPRYFSRYFKTEFGMLPSQYIASKKEE